MKKLLLVLVTVMVLCIMVVPALADGGQTVIPAQEDSGQAISFKDRAIDLGVQLLATLAITAISIGGVWLELKISKHKELENINIAQLEVIRAAKTTVGELQQTVVDGLKASHADGKLTKHEIIELGDMLIDKTVQKLSMPAYNLLKAATVDINALITGVGENWISWLKQMYG